MGERGRQVLLGGLVVIAASPAFSFLLCPHRAECLHAMGQVGVWLAGGAKVGLVLAASSLLAWAARLGWLVHADAGLVRTLPRSRSLPSALQTRSYVPTGSAA